MSERKWPDIGPDTISPTPPAKPPKKPSEISRDNEIKMQMAKDLLSSFIRDRALRPQNNPDNFDFIGLSCDIADRIFNRFNK